MKKILFVIFLSLLLTSCGKQLTSDFWATDESDNWKLSKNHWLIGRPNQPIVYKIYPSSLPSTGPNSLPTLITITGERFLSTATVTAGSIPCGTVIFISSTTIYCILPGVQTGGNYPIIVSNNDGNLPSRPSVNFQYVPPPAIIGCDNANDGNGSSASFMTIYGKFFQQGMTETTSVCPRGLGEPSTTPGALLSAAVCSFNLPYPSSVTIQVINPDGQVSNTITCDSSSFVPY